MKRLFTYPIFAALLIFSLTGCGSDYSPIAPVVKTAASDPFQTSITPSQFIELDAKEDHVVEGKNGTLLVFPKGCFKNAKGEVVTENVQVELTEALSMDEMVLSNLTTTADGKLLETDGMIYWNATANGEQLKVDSANPIYIEIPTRHKKPDMEAYKGIRDEKGNMNWVNPKKLENYLVNIDISLLDFYPPGFKEAVESGLPFRGHTEATPELLDSLYYSFSVSNEGDLIKGFAETDVNEAYYDRDQEVVNGQYQEKKGQKLSSDLTEDKLVDLLKTAIDTMRNNASDSAFGNYFSRRMWIDPSIIKVLKSEEYRNTYIWTREFEERLMWMFYDCRGEVLNVYIKNIDQDLWVSDSITYLGGAGYYYYSGIPFFNDRKTNVRGANKNVGLLSQFFNEKLKTVKNELEAVRAKAMAELETKNEMTQAVVTEYKEVLMKREKSRMETYGFEWTETGWINIDRGTIPKDWGPKRLELFIQDGKSYDRVHCYVVYTSIKSLYRFNSDDDELFYVGNQDEKEMLMPKEKKAVCVAIGYKGETPYFSLREFITGTEDKITLSLSESSEEAIKKAISPFDSYGQENQIDHDLSYMKRFAEEQKRQKRLMNESKWISLLRRNVRLFCDPRPVTIIFQNGESIEY